VRSEAFFDQQNGGRSEEHVVTETGFGGDQPGDHTVQRNDLMPGVSKHVNIVEASPCRSDAAVCEHPAVASHRLDRGRLEDGERRRPAVARPSARPPIAKK